MKDASNDEQSIELEWEEWTLVNLFKCKKRTCSKWFLEFEVDPVVFCLYGNRGLICCNMGDLPETY